MEGAPTVPWLAFPETLAGSIGWRMGPGEDAYNAFYRWYSGLTDAHAGEFAKQNPEPSGWEGWYERIRTNKWD